jgi:glycosyltransferase involved in cell wall biosynthesis
MKILVVGNRFPWPLHDGGAIASYRLLKSLSSAGHEIVFFSFNTDKHHVSSESIQKEFSFCRTVSISLNADVKPLDALKNLFKPNSYFIERYNQKEAQTQLKQLVSEEKFDLAILEGFYSSAFLPVLKDQLPVIYRAHNLEYQIWQRLAENESSWLKRVYLKIQVKRLKKEEINLLNQVNATIAISPNDASIFQQLGPKPVHLYLPGVEIQINGKSKLQPQSLFHLGSMEWDANQQGVEWFLRKVWPLVLSEHPDLTFHLAGKGLKKSDSKYFQQGVMNHGEVNDAREFMLNHGICIVPILAGSGIRMKLLDAMNFGIPCVATSIGAQGLKVESGNQLEIADNPKDFAAKIIGLLNDRLKAIQMGKNAAAYIQENHNPVINFDKLNQFIVSVTS